MKHFQHHIMIRWPNVDDGDYFRVAGLLVNESTALALFDGHIEVHLVTPTPDPNEFDLRYASNPIFHVGDDYPEIFHDIASLTIAEMAAKYSHSDFSVPALT